MAAPADIMYLCWLTLKPAFRYRKNVQTIKKADPERATIHRLVPLQEAEHALI